MVYCNNFIFTIGHVTSAQSEVTFGIITGFVVLLLILLGLIITFISIIVILLKIKAKLTLELKKEKDKNIYDVVGVVGSTQIPQAAGMDTAVNIAYTYIT